MLGEFPIGRVGTADILKVAFRKTHLFVSADREDAGEGAVGKIDIGIAIIGRQRPAASHIEGINRVCGDHRAVLRPVHEGIALLSGGGESAKVPLGVIGEAKGDIVNIVTVFPGIDTAILMVEPTEGVRPSRHFEEMVAPRAVGASFFQPLRPVNKELALVATLLGGHSAIKPYIAFRRKVHRHLYIGICVVMAVVGTCHAVAAGVGVAPNHPWIVARRVVESVIREVTRLKVNATEHLQRNQAVYKTAIGRIVDRGDDMMLGEQGSAKQR